VDPSTGVDAVKNSLMPGVESRFFGHIFQIVVTIPTELSCLQHISYNGGQIVVLLLFRKVVPVHNMKACRVSGGEAPHVLK
jgi:hypothetical protein